MMYHSPWISMQLKTRSMVADRDGYPRKRKKSTVRMAFEAKECSSFRAHWRRVPQGRKGQLGGAYAREAL